MITAAQLRAARAMLGMDHILAAHYGQGGQVFSTGDLNNDGSVNIFDLSILAAYWGT